MTAINLPLTYTRQELRDRLLAMRATAEKVDERNLAEHQKAEAAYIAAFQKACTKAAKWTYEQAREHDFDPRQLMAKPNDDRHRYRNYPESPSCPRSEVSIIDQYLAMLDKTTQDRFTLSRHGKWHWSDVPSTRGLC